MESLVVGSLAAMACGCGVAGIALAIPRRPISRDAARRPDTRYLWIAAFAIIGRSRRRATASWKISEARSSQFPQQSAHPVARRTWSNECAPLSAASRIARSVTALQMQTYMALPGFG